MVHPKPLPSKLPPPPGFTPPSVTTSKPNIPSVTLSLHSAQNALLNVTPEFVPSTDQRSNEHHSVQYLPPHPPPALPPRSSECSVNPVDVPTNIFTFLSTEPTKIPPPIPPTITVPSVVSVLNPTPASNKPAPNYIISPSPTKSILRHSTITNTSASNAQNTPFSATKSNRVSFDLSGNLNRGLAPKSSNPSMPNISKLTRNPFLDNFDENIDNDDCCFTTDDVTITNLNLERSGSTERLGATFFASLLTNNFPDPWSTPQVPAKPTDATPKSNFPSASAASPFSPRYVI